MKQFDVNKYTGLKRRIAISLDCYHCAIDSQDHKGEDHVRGIYTDGFEDVIEDIYSEMMDIMKIQMEVCRR